MTQRMATTWANEVEIALSTELDNPHALTAAEIAFLMTHTMRTFCLKVREENEYVIEHDPPSAELLAERAREGMTVSRQAEHRSGIEHRERERFEEAHRDREQQRKEVDAERD